MKTKLMALMLLAGGSAFAESHWSVFFGGVPNYYQPRPSYSYLDPQQLDSLVAPIALYPDALLSQVLVACTYPDQLAAAQQFLAQYPGLSGAYLVEAAQQQPWDPSIQALVAFPDLIARLNQDPSWTNELGQAFRTDQESVMSAIQYMRQLAYQAGRVQSNAQQVVRYQYVDATPVIEIEPLSADLLYVPVYNPAYYWGVPAYGYYPRLWYPGVNMGCYYGSGIHLGFYFGSRWSSWGGWSGWGWRPNWGGRSVIVDNTFIQQNGFHESSYRGGYRGERGFSDGDRRYDGRSRGFASRENYSDGNRGYAGDGRSYDNGNRGDSRGNGTYNNVERHPGPATAGGPRGGNGSYYRGSSYPVQAPSKPVNRYNGYQSYQSHQMPATLPQFRGGNGYSSSPQAVPHFRGQAPQLTNEAPSYQQRSYQKPASQTGFQSQPQNYFRPPQTNNSLGSVSGRSFAPRGGESHASGGDYQRSAVARWSLEKNGSRGRLTR